MKSVLGAKRDLKYSISGNSTIVLLKLRGHFVLEIKKSRFISRFIILVQLDDLLHVVLDPIT